MQQEFSKFESQVSLLLKANIPIPTIDTTLNKPQSSIRNTIKRINKKKQKDPKLKRVKAGQILKLTKKKERVINRDLSKDPKKENNSLLGKNKLKILKRLL